MNNISIVEGGVLHVNVDNITTEEFEHVLDFMKTYYVTVTIWYGAKKYQLSYSKGFLSEPDCFSLADNDYIERALSHETFLLEPHIFELDLDILLSLIDNGN